MRQAIGQRILLAAALALLPATGRPAAADRAARAEALARRAADEKQATLTAGKAALEDGLYAVAEREFGRYLRKASTPDERAEGTLLLARVQFARGSYDGVVDLLTRRGSWAEGTPFAGAFVLWTGLARFEQGQYPEVLKLTENFSKRFADSPAGPDATRLRARCFVRMKRYEDALDAYTRFQKHFAESPEAPDNLLDWSATLAEMEKRGDALDVLDRLIGTYPASEAATQGRLWAGKLYAERQEWGKAQEVLKPLATLEGARRERRAAAWFALADAYEATTNLTDAIDALEKGAGITPDKTLKIRADAARGRLLIRSGRVDDGAALLREVVRTKPTDAFSRQTQLDLAQALLDQRLYRQSAEEFQHYLEAFADKEGQAWAQLGKGWSLWGLERYAEAATVFEKAYYVHTNAVRKAQALFKAADSYFANQQYQLAKDRYDEFLNEFPSDPLAPQARLQSAECMFRYGKNSAAEDAFKALAQAGAGDWYAEEAIMRIARIKEKERQWEQAMAAYDQVLASSSNAAVSARALQARGLIRYRLGRFADALADLERVVADYGQSELAEQAFFMRGWCQYLLGKDEEALVLCRNFMEKYPRSRWAPGVLFWLGEYHFNHGNYSAAERQFAGLAEQYPKGPMAEDALYWAGRSAAATKDYLRAIEYYNKLTKGYPDSPKLPETRFAQGDTLSELGQFDGAILAFDEVIRKYPDSYLADLAWGRKGDCQFTLGTDEARRYHEAMASYQAVLGSPRAAPDLKAQAEYKIGRCWEKTGKQAEAFEHYMNVVYTFLSDLKKGTPASPLWFTRAAFSAAALKEGEEKWREAVSIYKRVADAGVPAAAEAQARMEKIRDDHAIVF